MTFFSMKLRHIIISLTIIPLIAWGQNASSNLTLGTYSSSSNSTINTMKISNKGAKTIVEFSVANKTGCTGEVSGELKLTSNNHYLFDKNDVDGKCRINVQKLSNGFRVVEDSCVNFHGISCDFSSTLKKIK